MILQRFSRPHSLLRRAAQCSSCLKQQAPFSRPQQRSLHEVPLLNDDETLKVNGVRNLLSRGGFEMAWVDYQDWLTYKLNEITAGTPDENLDAKSLLIKTARNPNAANIFNYASMAFNNHFFFNGITNAEEPAPISDHILTTVKDNFDSLETLRETFISTADSMFGPGFVWLVQTKDTASREPKLRILNTYLAGSPLAAAHWRKQNVDMNHQSTASLDGSIQPLGQQEHLRAQHTEVQNMVGSVGPFSGQAQPTVAPGGSDVTPLLCVNTWEHVWLRDYGIGGKRAFLEAWWDRINWSVVESSGSFSVTRTNKFLY